MGCTCSPSRISFHSPPRRMVQMQEKRGVDRCLMTAYSMLTLHLMSSMCRYTTYTAHKNTTRQACAVIQHTRHTKIPNQKGMSDLIQVLRLENDSSKSWGDLTFMSSAFLRFPGSLKIRKQKMSLSNDDNSTSGMAIPICAWFVFWQEQMDGTYDPTSVLLWSHAHVELRGRFVWQDMQQFLQCRDAHLFGLVSLCAVYVV